MKYFTNCIQDRCIVLKFFTHCYTTREDVEKATEEFFVDNVQMVSMTFVPYVYDKDKINKLKDAGLGYTIPNPYGEFVVMWQRLCNLVKEDTCSICGKTGRVYYCELHKHWVCIDC